MGGLFATIKPASVPLLQGGAGDGRVCGLSYNRKGYTVAGQADPGDGDAACVCTADP